MVMTSLRLMGDLLWSLSIKLLLFLTRKNLLKIRWRRNGDFQYLQKTKNGEKGTNVDGR